MTRRATVGVAAGITLCLAAIAATIIVNLGIMSAKAPTSGPGTFQPTAALIATPTTTSSEATTSTTPSATSPPSGTVETPGSSDAVDADHDGDTARHVDGRDDDD